MKRRSKGELLPRKLRTLQLPVFMVARGKRRHDDAARVI